VYSLDTVGVTSQLLHWEKSWENFEKFLYFPEIFTFFPPKWANYSPILRKKMENFGKNAKFSQHFLAIFPSVGLFSMIVNASYLDVRVHTFGSGCQYSLYLMSTRLGSIIFNAKVVFI